MEHLSIDEMIKYVTASKVDKDTLELLSKVNAHMRKCSECREQVDLYQSINDKMLETVFVGETVQEETSLLKKQKIKINLNN